MFSNFEIKVASRYLKSRKKQGFISFVTGFSLLGISLGVAALIVVMAVMGGFHKEISSKMIGWGGDVNLSNYNGSLTNHQQLINQIKNIPDVTGAFSIITGQVMITTNNSTSGGIVKAMSLQDIMLRPIISENIIEGNLSDFNGNNSIIIGSDLAYILNVGVGDKVTLISPAGVNTVIGFIPRIKTYNIIAIFKSGMYQYDSSTILMPLEAAQIYFKMPSAVSSIEVVIKNPYNSHNVAKILRNKLGINYQIDDWQITNASYFNVLKTERVVMFLILTLIIIVAAFNIISSLTMLVVDKNKDIAILRTMGATKSNIMKIFILCGSTIGFMGTLIGIMLGLSFALNIERIRQFLESSTGATIFDPIAYYLSSLPSEVEISDVIIISIMSFLLSLIATFYPAYAAAKIEPAEGLRYE
ncbi:MAG: lipoprotein-releasing ABC transporter permease subunit [Alphaproteobacteria bacterium]